MTLHGVDRTYITNWESRISAKVLLHMELENEALIVERHSRAYMKVSKFGRPHCDCGCETPRSKGVHPLATTIGGEERVVVDRVTTLMDKEDGRSDDWIVGFFVEFSYID